MSGLAETAQTLRNHLALCQELLLATERENRDLCSSNAGSTTAFDFHLQRKRLLPLLDQSLADLKKHRAYWMQLPPQVRARHPEIAELLRSNQNLIMKIVVLDRDNEQSRLRLGLLPANHLPPAQAQRPHFVADLYRRHSSPHSSTLPSYANRPCSDR
jgi:hypothetical protein